jgi:transposase
VALRRQPVLREFLRLGEREPVPDHSWLSRIRARLPLEVHDAVFTWVLQRLAERGLIRGERIGVDASTLEANTAMRVIVRPDTGEGYREMLTRMAEASGIETPTAEELVRPDRTRQGKKLSNAEWASPTDPDARSAKLKDDRTHLAYKPEQGEKREGIAPRRQSHATARGPTAAATAFAVATIPTAEA